MKEFNLEEYLKNPDRKVVTRDGNIVEIIYTKGKGMFPVIVIDPYEEGETEPWQVTENGKLFYDGDNDPLDIFFADEEEELTEFEKAIYQHTCTIVISCSGEVYGDKELKPIVKGIAKELLDLARKELEKEYDLIPFVNGKVEDSAAYYKGKANALKDLPKWKKVDSNLPKVQYNLQGKRLYKNGEYYIELIDLEMLPKEEQL